MSSLALVLLILILGSLLLQGLNRQQQSTLAQVTVDTTATRDNANAESALQWGRMQRWETQTTVQCRSLPAFFARVCLRIFDGNVLLIAHSGGATRWQSGTYDREIIAFSPHGWSDFCPLKEVALCQQP